MKTKEGGWAPITNYGTGTLEVSASARVGAITSVGAVALRSAAKVTGSVTSAGRVEKDSTAQVSGAIKQFASVNLPPLPTISNPWPPISSQVKVLGPDQKGSITPGTYKLVSVASRATLEMAPGTYYIEDLQVLEPQSVVKLSGATTIEVKTRFVHRGAFRNSSGAAAPVAVRYRGSEQVFLDTSFYGSVLAPNATVTLGGTTNLTFRGQFIARRLEVRPDLIITTEEPPGATVALANHATGGPVLRLEESAPLAAEAADTAEADSDGGCSMSAAPSPSVWSPALVLLGLLLRRNRKERRASC